MEGADNVGGADSIDMSKFEFGCLTPVEIIDNEPVSCVKKFMDNPETAKAAGCDLNTKILELLGGEGPGCQTFPNVLFAGDETGQMLVGAGNLQSHIEELQKAGQMPMVSQWDQYFFTTGVNYDARYSSLAIMIAILIGFKLCTLLCLQYVKHMNR